MKSLTTPTPMTMLALLGVRNSISVSRSRVLLHE